MKKHVLFVCTHNSARSQMAEGILRAFYGDVFEASSAGTAPRGVHPMAIQALKEWSIDLSGHQSKLVSDLAGIDMDYVVTVCDSANETCPYVPSTVANLHKGFLDPSAQEGTADERLQVFRVVRDDIKAWIDGYFEPIARNTGWTTGL